MGRELFSNAQEDVGFTKQLLGSFNVGYLKVNVITLLLYLLYYHIYNFLRLEDDL